VKRVVVVLCCAVSLAWVSVAAADSPRIVPWKQIGAIELGDNITRAEYLYGEPQEIESLFFPVGTRYHGRAGVRHTYKVPGGELWVEAIDGRIKALATTSPRYRTPTGLHVGSRIPLGPCHRNSYGSCDYRWKSFAYEPVCPPGWIGGTKKRTVFLSMSKGVVQSIYFGDPQVMLLCF
jgi:hypothetical protein